MRGERREREERPKVGESVISYLIRIKVVGYLS